MIKSFENIQLQGSGHYYIATTKYTSSNKLYTKGQF